MKKILAGSKKAGTHRLLDHSGNLQSRDNQGKFGTARKFVIEVVEEGKEATKNETLKDDHSATKELVASLTVEVTLANDKRVTVSGKTSLPAETILMITVQDAERADNPAQHQATVQSDGSYKSRLLGSLSGWGDGKYLASVTMPFSLMQPKAVQQIIGEKGQNLKGSLVWSGGLDESQRPHLSAEHVKELKQLSDLL